MHMDLDAVSEEMKAFNFRRTSDAVSSWDMLLKEIQND
jgi:hypothetical protein